MSCPFCGAGRGDGMQTHALDCEWCTLLGRVANLERRLDNIFSALEELVRRTPPKESNGSSESPDTQRSGKHYSASIGWICGTCGISTERGCLCPPTADCAELHPDPRPTEPAGSPDAGANAATGGPAGTEPGS